MTILLIEDDIKLANLIRFKLESHNILIADCIKTAQEILATIRPVLLIVDLNLPDSEGLATLSVLKDYNIPKIVVSSYCKEVACDAVKMGAIDYIRKTNAIEDIIARINFNIEKYRPKQRFSPSAFKEIKACLSY